MAKKPTAKPKRARAQKGSTEQETEAARSSEVRKVTPVPTLKSLAISARKTRKGLDEIAAAYGSEVKTAVEKKHLDRKAWASVVMEDKMEPERLADFYSNQEHYREALGLTDRAAQVQRMQFGPGEGEQEGEGEEGEDGESDDGESNVRHLRAAE